MPNPDLIIIFIFATIIVVASLIAWLISQKINQASVKNSLIHDQGFMLALREYKEKTERRISALEAELADLKKNNSADEDTSATPLSEPTDTQIE